MSIEHSQPSTNPNSPVPNPKPIQNPGKSPSNPDQKAAPTPIVEVPMDPSKHQPIEQPVRTPQVFPTNPGSEFSDPSKRPQVIGKQTHDSKTDLESDKRRAEGEGMATARKP